MMQQQLHFPATENYKENMALSSNLRVSAIKKAKARRKMPSGRKRQKRIDGKLVLEELRFDDVTKVCDACKKMEGKPGWKGFAHDPTCTRNKDYQKSCGGRKDQMEMLNEALDAERLKQFNSPFEGAEIHSLENPASQEDVDAYLAPRKTIVPVLLPQPQPQVTIIEAAPSGQCLSVSMLKEEIKKLMTNSTASMKRSASVPDVVGAAFEVMLDLFSIQCTKNSNQLMTSDKRAKGHHNMQRYKQIFPPGTLGFTFPKDDKTKQPDHYYSQLEGRTIYLVRWEQNIPGLFLNCFDCDDGELIHDTYDFKSHGYATPIFDISGRTDWACSMMYRCNKCKAECKGNDGRLLAMLPPQYRNAYPVDPRYAVKKETHLNQSLTRVSDSLMITHGGGEQISLMVSAIRGEFHLDMEEEYYSQSKATQKKLAKPLPPFEDSIGRYGLSGQELRDLKDFAAQSTLLSTGVSDMDRVRREIQGVGATTTVCNDHTYATLRNYIAADIENAKCGHTIGVDSGEIASFVIVPDEKQIHYAHQAEQFPHRPNVSLTIHVSDICPQGIGLWQKLFTGVICRLGWFHFLQRITKTLRKEHVNYAQSIGILQECLYWLDVGDLAKVKHCIEAGLLGTNRKGSKPCPADKIHAKAKTYRENIRVWSFGEAEIIGRLKEWLTKFQHDFDENIGELLFTDWTVKVVQEQMKNAKWATDKLSKDTLYIQLEPGSISKTRLPIFIGRRGAESKVEKGHHAIAHFANGGMRCSLADFLGMAGIALYNLKIRYRLKMRMLDPKERKKIPTAFHGAPHFTNHLRMSLNNTLAREAGLTLDVHKAVEILQQDNGERFFSEYLFEQLERIERGVSNHIETNRCLCDDCGGGNHINPYAKRKTQSINNDHTVSLGPWAPSLRPITQRKEENAAAVSRKNAHAPIAAAYLELVPAPLFQPQPPPPQHRLHSTFQQPGLQRAPRRNLFYQMQGSNPHSNVCAFPGNWVKNHPTKLRRRQDTRAVAR
jgi:hypothetical protein